MQRFLILFLFVTAVISTGCGGERENDPVVATTETLDLALTEAIDYSVLPAVDAFHQDAEILVSRSSVFCDLKDQTNLDLLQDQWRNLSKQWHRLSNYNFGPLNDDPVFPDYTFFDSLRLRGTNYTETVRTEISNNLENDLTLDSAYFSSLTFQKVGILALELSIFETASIEHSTTQSDILLEYQDEPRKCDILLGLARQIETRALSIKNEWRVAYDPESGSTSDYRSLFLSDQISDGTAPITLLLVSVQEYLDYLRNRNVVSNTAQVSNYSWQLIEASIDEVELLLTGKEQTTVSIFNLMVATGNENSVTTVQANIAGLRDAIAQQDINLLDIGLSLLDGNFKREIPNSLDVDLGINFTDGD